MSQIKKETETLQDLKLNRKDTKVWLGNISVLLDHLYMFLVKIPSFLNEQWCSQPPMSELGRLRIYKE